MEFNRDGKENILHLTQWVPHSPEKLFPFFSVETNLEMLTPPDLHFRVLQKSTPTIQEGTLIDYRLKMHGFPLRWRTRIEGWAPPHRFVDKQLIGPYLLWQHTHTFSAQDGGTVMTDSVRYILPFAPLSDWLLGWFIRRELKKIFQFRYAVVEQKFGLLKA